MQLLFIQLIIQSGPRLPLPGWISSQGLTHLLALSLAHAPHTNPAAHLSSLTCAFHPHVSICVILLIPPQPWAWLPLLSVAGTFGSITPLGHLFFLSGGGEDTRRRERRSREKTGGDGREHVFQNTNVSMLCPRSESSSSFLLC